MRWTSSGAVHVSRCQLSPAIQLQFQPATIGWPLEWRDGW
jgi:hypothetical protein